MSNTDSSDSSSTEIDNSHEDFEELEEENEDDEWEVISENDGVVEENHPEENPGEAPPRPIQIRPSDLRLSFVNHYADWRKACKLRDHVEKMLAEKDDEESTDDTPKSEKALEGHDGSDESLIPTEESLLIPNKDYPWRHLLEQAYMTNKEKMLAPYGPRTERKPFEYPELDAVQQLPLLSEDVEFVLGKLRPFIHETHFEAVSEDDVPRIATDDLEMTFVAASAICRRYLLEYAPNSQDLGVEPCTLRIVQLSKATREVWSSHDPQAGMMLAFLLKNLLEFRQLAAKQVTRILCDMTKQAIGPIDMKAEALRINAIQKKHVSDTRDPKLDLDERALAELTHYIRSCAPMWPENEEEYLLALVKSLPKVMSVPHPLSGFAIRPLNPVVALGNHFTCDLCYTPHIRATYQAVQDDGSKGDRNMVELIKNCIGFDFCIRCSAQYFNEALVAVANAVRWSSASKYITEKKENTGKNLVNQIALVEEIGHLNPTTPVQLMPGSPAHQNQPVRLKLVASGQRPIIDINNQLRLVETAHLRKLPDGNGMLLINCAVAPMGARPLARKWKDDYTKILEEGVQLFVSSESPADSACAANESLPAIAFKRLFYLSLRLKPYFVNATRCLAKRRLGAEEREVCEESAKDGEDDETVCPICLEALYPRLNTDATDEPDDPDKDFAFRALSQKANEKSSSATADDEGTSSALVRATVQTTCRHWFHAPCIDAFFATKKATQCPLCRTNNCLNTLTAQRFNASSEESEPETDQYGSPIEKTVTPAMIASETAQNLTKNVYELRIPLTAAEVTKLTSRNNTLPKDGDEQHSSLKILVGTLVSLDGQYHNPTDIGCLGQFEVTPL